MAGMRVGDAAIETIWPGRVQERRCLACCRSLL